MGERKQEINVACALIAEILKSYQLTLTVQQVKGVYAPILIDGTNGERYAFFKDRGVEE